MRAETVRFQKTLEGCTCGQLSEIASSLFEQKSELEARAAENEKIFTEMSIQYTELKAKYEELSKDYETTKELLAKELDKNALQNKQIFGSHTERFVEMVENGTRHEPEDESAEEDPGVENDGKPGRGGSLLEDRPSGGNNSGSGGESRQGGGKTNRLAKSLDALPQEYEYALNTEELDNLYGRGNWRIAHWHKHRVLEKIPCVYVVRNVYTPAVSVKLEHSLYTVAYQNPILDRSCVSDSILAYILYMKFALGLTFYREAADFEAHGVCLSRQTIINWVNKTVPTLLAPVVKRLQEILFSYRYVQSDETYIPVNESGKDFFWVHCSSELLDEHPITVFCYEKTRGTDHLRRLFEGFCGYNTSDAYVSYQTIEKEMDGVKNTGCLMHCRRYYATALFLNNTSEMTDGELLALPETQALIRIRDIYRLEKPLAGLTAEERLKKRQEVVKPAVDAFFEYVHGLDGSDTVYSDRLSKAITYSVNQEEYLRRFLNDGNIPIDNGNVERHIRAFSIGRSNWLFADTVLGAEVNAIMYSLTETAKANRAAIELYLKYLLNRMPEYKPEMGNDFLDRMMPWTEEYRLYEEKEKHLAIESFSRMFPKVDPPKTPRKNAL